METAQCTPYENSPSRHKPLRTNEAWDKVVRTIEDLKLQGNLSGAQAKCVREAVDVLKTTQTSGRRKKYKRFLFNVLQESGPQAVLVCAAALGQVKATNMKESDRNLLNRKIDGCKNINHSTIQSLASRYQIPRSEGDVLARVSPLPQDMIEQHRERSQPVTPSPGSITPLRIEGVSPAVSASYKNSSSPKEAHGMPTPIPEMLPSNPDSTDRRNQTVINASLEGVANVFGEHMALAIRRVSVPSDGLPAMKAAVTMEFPDFVLVDCVMMLEVGETEVERLMKDLFGIAVESVMGLRHLLLEGGVRLTSNTSNPEITLKGVQDEGILRVFGPEIYRAIRASKMYRREIQEKSSSVTECVSMIFTSKSGEGAYINLCLDLKGGLEIRDKLYN